MVLRLKHESVHAIIFIMKEYIPFPTTVDLALTGRCNLRCKHCNTADTWSVKNEMSYKEIISVLDQLKELKIFNLNLFGGEPFYYPGIKDILRVLNDYPFRLDILTNGTLIDDELVEVLKEQRCLANIQVSLDGARAETHDWQRGKGAFDKTVAGIERLAASGLPFSVKAVINSRNYREIRPMAELAMQLGLEAMDFGDAVACGKAALYSSDMKFEANTHKAIMKEVLALKKELPRFGVGGTLGQKLQMLDEFYGKGPGGGSRGTYSRCPAGWNMLSIRSDGGVVPCSAFWTLICGNARANKLLDIWEGSNVLEDIRALAGEPLIERHPRCEGCDYLSFCNGGCRASAYYSAGEDLRGLDPANCMVFSSLYSGRVERSCLQEVVNGKS
ncbi:MAG: radical SAM protein [Candidatus Omnitrophica bacterium]|nr:radical SAM protein [Candidatus Omnitrophota bacterium]